ncbi:MAG: membrane protein insertion efficiency factor YidD [Wolinella sp.]
MRALFLGIIAFYQRFISPLKHPSCRYYPSCSEYALWLFKYSNIWSAIPKVLARVTRCNSLFIGGIDYPIVSKKLTPTFVAPRAICVWLIPLEQRSDWSIKGKFYLIKRLH